MSLRIASTAAPKHNTIKQGPLLAGNGPRVSRNPDKTGVAPNITISPASLRKDIEDTNRHMVMRTDTPGDQSVFGARVDSRNDENDVPAHGGAAPAAATQDSGGDSGSAETAPKITYGTLKIPARPPLYVRANAEIKKEAEAQRGGYTAETLKGIERREVTVSLIGGKF